MKLLCKSNLTWAGKIAQQLFAKCCLQVLIDQTTDFVLKRLHYTTHVGSNQDCGRSGKTDSIILEWLLTQVVVHSICISISLNYLFMMFTHFDIHNLFSTTSGPPFPSQLPSGRARMPLPPECKLTSIHGQGNQDKPTTKSVFLILFYKSKIKSL